MAEPAQVEQANGYRIGQYLVLRIAGERPTACYEVDIEQLPIDIFPPEFAATWAQDPRARCIQVVAPYERVEAFEVGGEFEQVTLRTAGGNIEVPVETLAEPEGAARLTLGDVLGEPAEAVGYSKNWDLAEAMQDAISKLPPRGIDIPDWLSTYTVVEIGAQVGGIAGFNDLTVRVRG